ncbi:MAG: hypothetical protein JRJ50_13065 [Deltaproteobacteria bacterium]|nr:hypothetical protein [Deltaproteobacteria bacterium]
MVVEKYTPRKCSLWVPTRKAPNAVMVSPGIGGKIFSTNALRPKKKYMRKSGSELRKFRKPSRFVICLFPSFHIDGHLQPATGRPQAIGLICFQMPKNKNSFALTGIPAFVISIVVPGIFRPTPGTGKKWQRKNKAGKRS